MHSVFLLSLDPALGRLDYDSLSDQALMEILISGMNNYEKANFQDENGNFLEISEWDGVQFESDRVTSIQWLYLEFSEQQFPFAFIPLLVRCFQVSHASLCGTLDPSLLPTTLDDFDVSINALDGSIDFSAFPRAMQTIDISWNLFAGSCALGDLPDALTHFIANHNVFEGEIVLSDLPVKMEKLILNGNRLTGPLRIESLPASVEEISLAWNKLSGDFYMGSFPESLQKVDFSNNPMSGKAILSRVDGEMHFQIVNTCIASVEDENGDKHAWEPHFLRW